MEKVEIFNLKGMGMSIRYTEYKEITSAISELVDNSIEANAKIVLIFIMCGIDRITKKETVKDIYVLDDGDGMNRESLHKCLSFGSTTKYDAKSIGKFGVGLGQASMFAAPEVKVYSWQHGIDNALMTGLSSLKMISGEQTHIEAPVSKKLPDEVYRKIKTHLKSDNFNTSGTLVHWIGVDKNPYKKVSTLVHKAELKLGRVFRKYLENDVKIEIIPSGCNNAEVKDVELIDPLFLSTKAKYLGYNYDIVSKFDVNRKLAIPFFVPYKSKTFNIVLENGKKGIVKVDSSIVREEFYYSRKFLTSGSPGDKPIGKQVKEQEGISILRANREIDFGRFGIYEVVNNPTHRWWGMSISFDSSLDDFFKVSSNKQHVEIPTLSKLGLERDHNPYDSNWNTIIKYCQDIIKEIGAINKKRAKSFREWKKSGNNEEKVDIINNDTIENTNNESIDEVINRSDLENTLFGNIKNVAKRLDIKTKNIIFRKADYNDDLIKFDLKNGLECIFIINMNSTFFDVFEMDDIETMKNMLKLMLLNLMNTYKNIPGLGSVEFIGNYIKNINLMVEEMTEDGNS